MFPCVSCDAERMTPRGVPPSSRALTCDYDTWQTIFLAPGSEEIERSMSNLKCIGGAPLLSSHGKKGQNILKEFDDRSDEARYVGDC